MLIIRYRAFGALGNSASAPRAKLFWGIYMAEKKKKTDDRPGGNTLAIVIVIAAVGVVLAFGIGFVAGGGSSGGEVRVVMDDGMPLDERLARLESSIEGGGQQEFVQSVADIEDRSNKIVLGEIKKALDGKFMDMLDPPARMFDLAEADEFASKGPKDAVITLLEFSDFQCPYCSRMAKALDEIHEKYPDKVRLIFIDRPLITEYRDGYPFHPYAYIAHEAGLEARAQGKFWEMYDWLFENQKSLFPGRPANQEDYEAKQAQVRDKLVEAAKELGLDAEKMRTSLDKNTHARELDRAIALSDKLRIHSTPTIYFNPYLKLSDPGAVVRLVEDATALK